VGLKVLAPETAEVASVGERFVRESRIAASLTFPPVRGDAAWVAQPKVVDNGR
jgi:hypothetical protein